MFVIFLYPVYNIDPRFDPCSEVSFILLLMSRYNTSQLFSAEQRKQYNFFFLLLSGLRCYCLLFDKFTEKSC